MGCEESYHVYHPKGFGYVIKFSKRGGHTKWIHKTYATLVGIKSKYSGCYPEKSEVYFIYKIPEMKLEAVISNRKGSRFEGYRYDFEIIGDNVNKWRDIAGDFEDEVKFDLNETGECNHDTEI